MFILRWILFLAVGLPSQILIFPIYPILHAYWRIFVFKESGDKKLANHTWVDGSVGSQTRNNGLFLDNKDDHGAFTMYGFIQKAGLEALVTPEGDFVRRVNEDGSYNQNWVSGDVVSAWTFAYTAPNILDKPKEALKRATWNYLTNLGTRSNDKFGKGVSARCNNFGINYVQDGWGKIGQPMGGPQFYTTSALLALASKEYWYFKPVFWTHWLLMGGWYWAWSPVIHSKENQLWYVRDITMKNLYVLKYVFGNQWWIKKPMEKIAFEMTEQRNDLHYAMMGLPPVKPLPPSMNAFFSQKGDATSRLTPDMSAYLPKAIYDLAEQARLLNGKR